MYRYHFRILQKFFDPDRQLCSFHEQHFRDYQKWRSSDGGGASLINHELGALSQVLHMAGLWHPISQYYERLPEKNWAPPKVMTAEEENRFLRFGRQREEWKTALNAALITGNTTVAGCELRTMKLEHLHLSQRPPVILVPETVKNRHRVRSVPLNETALVAVREMVALARARGSSEPHHYLVPFRIKIGTYDPSRPASSSFIRASFRGIAKAASLGWVTPTTFRHQAITKLLESGAPEETVRAIAGHVTEKAMKFYSHIRIEAKKEAVDLLAPQPHKLKSPKVPGPIKAFPLLNNIKGTARRLGISDEAALELILSHQPSQCAGNTGGAMEQRTKEYIRSLLSLIKTLYAENYALRAMNQACPIKEIRETWEGSLKDVLEMPETKREIDSRFDMQIERIMELLDSEEAIAALLKMPTKGLPN